MPDRYYTSPSGVRGRIENSGCWLWKGSRNKKTGYGTMKWPVIIDPVTGSIKKIVIDPVTGSGDINKITEIGIHRISWMLTHPGETLLSTEPIDHLCHKRDGCKLSGLDCPHHPCGNPDHLERSTPQKNAQEGNAGEHMATPHTSSLSGWKLDKWGRAIDIAGNLVDEYYLLDSAEQEARLEATGKRMLDALPDGGRGIEARKINEQDAGWEGGIARPWMNVKPIAEDMAEVFAAPELYADLRYNPSSDAPPVEGNWYVVPSSIQGLSHYRYFGRVDWTDRIGWHDVDIVRGVMYPYDPDNALTMEKLRQGPPKRIVLMQLIDPDAPSFFDEAVEDSTLGAVWRTIFPKALPIDSGDEGKEDIPVVAAEIVFDTDEDAAKVKEVLGAAREGKKWWRFKR